MARNERVRKAFNAARELGIRPQEVKPVLKHLLKVSDGNWDHIESENYRLLIDAIFEAKEEKGVEDKENSIVELGGSSRSSKRLCLQELEDQASSTKDNSTQTLSPEENEKPTINLEQGVTFSNQILSPEENEKSMINLNIFNQILSSEENEKPMMKLEQGVTFLNKKDSSSSGCSNSLNKVQQQSVTYEKKRPSRIIADITKGTENVKISLIDEDGNQDRPKFTYMRDNVIYQDAYVHISLARVADEHCCSGCSGDCLSAPIPCACAQETGGEFAYTPEGQLREEFLITCMSMKQEPQWHHFVYCLDCPLERSKNEYKPEKCKGHLVRKFIKECWRKCGCDMQCGNRVVQRGIACKLQVFLTRQGKGWGLKTLQDLPKGTFVCEYVGEILTNTELYERNMKSCGREKHTYPVTLDADWGSEKVLKDEEALCLDATFCGNVARFINHRCFDANLIDIPVEVETPDRHYYHLALFTTRDVRASEELTWDYGIDFDDHEHPVKAFQCRCGSAFCRDVKRKGKRLAMHR